VQGSGTYVAQQKYQSTIVAIRNIADEIAGRGHVHRSDLQRLERIKAPEALAHARSCGQPSRGRTRRRSDRPKLAMTRATEPMFSASWGSFRMTTGGADIPPSYDLSADWQARG